MSTITDTTITIDGTTYDLAIFDQPQGRSVHLHQAGEPIGVGTHAYSVFRGRPVRRTRLSRGLTDFWNTNGWKTDEEIVRAILTGKPARKA